MKIAFFTFVSDNYYTPVGTPILINSFKKFHPDVPLIVFRQDWVDKIIDPSKKFMGGAVNWLNAKPMFAKLLLDKYDLIVNIDADSVVLGRLDELLDGDYDIGSVMNYNSFENRAIENVTDEMYLQAGLIASKDKDFWDIWMNESLKNNWKYKCAENDSMNIVIYNQLRDRKLKIFDKDKDYWGCKLLGKEDKCILERGKVMCEGEEVKIYHAAKGPMNLPKLTPEKLAKYGFNQDVVNHIHKIGTEGVTEVYASL